jgi:hypothetical protein
MKTLLICTTLTFFLFCKPQSKELDIYNTYGLSSKEKAELAEEYCISHYRAEIKDSTGKAVEGSANPRDPYAYEWDKSLSSDIINCIPSKRFKCKPVRSKTSGKVCVPENLKTDEYNYRTLAL